MNNVKDFGAVGDGIANDTAAIQKAIDAGGTVYIPGGTYRIGSIYLRSNGGLELANDAVLIGSTEPDDYNKKNFCQQDYEPTACGFTGKHLIIAVEQENIFIRGGKIDGNARNIIKDHTVTGDFKGGPQWPFKQWHPAQMIYICECQNVRLNDSTYFDSPAWACFLHGCCDVHVDGITIRNSPYVPEDDGIDVDCCSNVVVSNCDICVGDDAFTLRSSYTKKLKKYRPCEFVTVSNCIFRSYYAHAIRVGVGDGEIRHCQFSNIICHSSHMAIHINPKYSDTASGVEIHDIAFRNFHIDVEQFVFVRLDYKFVEKPFEKSAGNITFENIDGYIKHPSMLKGNGIGSLSDIRFANINLMVKGKKEIPENTRLFCMIEGTDGAFELENVRNVTFSNVNIKYEHPELWQADIIERNCENIVRK